MFDRYGGHYYFTCVCTCIVDSAQYSGCVVYGASTTAAVKVLLFTAAQDYAYLELNSSITERLCISISIIDNYLPGGPVNFSVKATSRSHELPPAITTIVILDDGMYWF